MGHSASTCPTCPGASPRGGRAKKPSNPSARRFKDTSKPCATLANPSLRPDRSRKLSRHERIIGSACKIYVRGNKGRPRATRKRGLRDRGMPGKGPPPRDLPEVVSQSPRLNYSGRALRHGRWG